MADAEIDSIDRLVSEGLIGATQAGKIMGGMWRQTVARFMIRGVLTPDGRRVTLEHIRCGGSRLMTSHAACLRFLKAQQRAGTTPADEQEETQKARPSRRSAAAKSAGERLKALGC